jgi:predicted kinase
VADLPHLVVVSGRGGSGKTTLAHRLAAVVGCPAICRDEIKEGMVHAFGPGFQPAVGDPLTVRTYGLFFETVALLLRGGVTVVAEAAFQHRLWEQGLTPLRGLCDLRVVRCSVPQDLLRARQRQRLAELPTRVAHADLAIFREQGEETGWDAIHLDVPTLDVDSSDGYLPALDEIADFAARPPDDRHS